MTLGISPWNPAGPKKSSSTFKYNNNITKGNAGYKILLNKKFALKAWYKKLIWSGTRQGRPLSTLLFNTVE